MSDKKNNPDSLGEQELLGSFYEAPKNSHMASKDSGRDRKKTSSIDRANANNGSLSNKKRDISALIYILRLLIILILLVVGFFLTVQGIRLYQERLLVERPQKIPSAVMSEVPLMDSTAFTSEESLDFFKNQCVQWQDEETNLRAARELIKREYLDKALQRCNYVLSLNPSNREALELIADLYTRIDRQVEAINAYVRLLNLDYKQIAVQEKLIESLYFHEDYQAVVHLSGWYYEKAMFNERVHYLLFHSYKKLDRMDEALEIANRILKASPDFQEIALNRIEILMALKRFNETIAEFDRLQAKRYRDPIFYRNHAACFAQLGQIKDAVEVLGKAVNIFGRSEVLSWLQSPDYDKIRNDAYFTTFSVRVGGEKVSNQIKALADRQEDQAQGGESYLIKRNIESLDSITPQLNILDKND